VSCQRVWREARSFLLNHPSQQELRQVRTTLPISRLSFDRRSRPQVDARFASAIRKFVQIVDNVPPMKRSNWSPTKNVLVYGLTNLHRSPHLGGGRGECSHLVRCVLYRNLVTECHLGCQPMSSCVETSHLSEASEALSRRRQSGRSSEPTLLDERYSSVWYALKTCPRHEKRVRDHLESRNIETFLPLYEKVHRWRNGCNARIDFPLFATYLFVCIDNSQRRRVLEVPGVLSFVGASYKPWPLSDFQIRTLRSDLHLRRHEPHTYLEVGQKVRIVSGPLTHFTGILLRRNGGLRVVLSVDQIMQGIAVEVGADEIETVPECATAQSEFAADGRERRVCLSIADR